MGKRIFTCVGKKKEKKKEKEKGKSFLSPKSKNLYNVFFFFCLWYLKYLLTPLP